MPKESALSAPGGSGAVLPSAPEETHSSHAPETSTEQKGESTQAASGDTANSSAVMGLRPYLPVLLLLFVGSGCAALIYEVVWFQLLQFVIGSSAVSLGVLLGTFMGGMCLGSLLLPKFVTRQAHPLRVYAWIELGIGACGLLV